MKNCDVIIVGAGPTGLVLALWLTKLGVAVRILDKTAESGTTSRALAVHARTLELYEQLDLSDAVMKNGLAVHAINLWASGRHETRVDFGDAGHDLTRYPFFQMFPQDEHEKLLIARLEAMGVNVERQTELTGFVESGDNLTAEISVPNGTEKIECRYLAGCDGARSKTREILDTGFPGGTYSRIFYVADVAASGPPVDGELHVDLDQSDFLALFPLKGQGRCRLIGTVKDTNCDANSLKFEDVSQRVIDNLKISVTNVNWFSTYRVHHRVTNHFRKGRAFLLGDAAHIHSPVGGQGMNTGIGDAINLAWKLKWVLESKAPDALLDSYEQERIAFARKLVETTDRAFTIASAEGPVADFLRTKVFPVALPAAVHFSAFREFMFRTVSQTLINYRGDAYSEGKAGSVCGGDRVPWVAGSENYKPLAEMIWQVHVYGTPTPGLVHWCESNHVLLTSLRWDRAFAEAGFKQDAAYLIRPDSYVALADEHGAAQAFEKYFVSRAMTP